VRYAVRQVLDQEFQKSILVRENAARQARYKLGNPEDDDSSYMFTDNKENKENKRDFDLDTVSIIKKDFFGRVLKDHVVLPLQERDGNVGEQKKTKANGKAKDDNKVWVSFHEGFSNAVRKPITVEELLSGL
jgi:chromosome transmission fidelity protein 18